MIAACVSVLFAVFGAGFLIGGVVGLWYGRLSAGDERDAAIGGLPETRSRVE